MPLDISSPLSFLYFDSKTSEIRYLFHIECFPEVLILLFNFLAATGHESMDECQSGFRKCFVCFRRRPALSIKFPKCRAKTMKLGFILSVHVILTPTVSM